MLFRTQTGPAIRRKEPGPLVYMPTMRRIIKGESMRPFLKALDVCVCENADPSSLVKGDIVIYKKSGDFVAHRIIRLNVPKKIALIKGDNLPSWTTEEVPFSEIMEKVISVERGRRSLSLENAFSCLFARSLAFLSGHDLMPGILKRRFADPVLLAITRSPVYVSIRKLFYRNISFSVGRQGKMRTLCAFLGRTKTAEAVLAPGEKGSVSMSFTIRHRDRNRYFAEIFLKKVLEIVDKEYGPGLLLAVKASFMPQGLISFVVKSPIVSGRIQIEKDTV